MAKAVRLHVRRAADPSDGAAGRKLVDQELVGRPDGNVRIS